jgi:ubiquitin-conjugating enzyme E2 S
LKHVLLTIKCLLIVPNPESALNEEAGKLLLERYDDYCTRAKIYTEIHAKPKNSEKASSSSTSDGSGASSATESETLAKKACNGVVTASATDKKALAKKEKSLKDKKKTLKRL